MKKGAAKTFVVVDAAHERPDPADALRRPPRHPPGPPGRRRRPSGSSPTSSAASARPATISRSTGGCRRSHAGDLIAIMTAGAYGAVQASTYNTRPLLPEILVQGQPMGGRPPAPDLRRADRHGPHGALARLMPLASCAAHGPAASLSPVAVLDLPGGRESERRDADGRVRAAIAPASAAASKRGRAARIERAIGRARLVLLWESVWPRLAPPRACSAALFATLSWLGLWRVVGEPVRIAVLAALRRSPPAVVLVRGLRIRRPTRAAALARVEQATGVAHRPATAFADRLAVGGERSGVARRCGLPTAPGFSPRSTA